MANYCPNCGTNVNSTDSFCKNCGTALNNANVNQTTTNQSDNILGTLVAVTLLGGITRQLYYYNGRYFLDPYCRNPFVGPRIMGPHRIIRPRGHMGMHPGPRPGGPRPGGPRPGGPGGFHGGPRPGGHR